MYSSSTIFPTSLPTIPKPVNIFSYLTFPSFIHHSPFTYLCPSNHQSIKSSMIYPTLAQPPIPIPTCQPSSIHPSSLSTNLSTSLPIPLSSTKPFGQYHLFYPPANPTIQSLHVPTTSSSDIPSTYSPLPIYLPTTLSIHQLFHPAVVFVHLPTPPSSSNSPSTTPSISSQILHPSTKISNPSAHLLPIPIDPYINSSIHESVLPPSINTTTAQFTNSTPIHYPNHYPIHPIVLPLMCQPLPTMFTTSPTKFSKLQLSLNAPSDFTKTPIQPSG